MGAYLSQPNTSKTSSDGGNGKLSYGFSAMQGWRVSMEVSNAMNAPETVPPNVCSVNKTNARCVSWRGEEVNSWQRRSKSSSHYQNGYGIIVELSWEWLA